MPPLPGLLRWPRARRLLDRLLGRRPPAPAPAPAPARRAVNLALQGGGAHGAFTWGVLDRLLEDERLDIAALSGASAGAMNAAALAAGWLGGGRDGARATLAALWRRVAEAAALRPLLTDTPVAQLGLGLMARLVSPYQFNPLQLNPLRTILDDLIDFERLRSAPKGAAPGLLIAATAVRDGRCRVFRREELSADAVLASACLPNLHHAVEIDGEPYWDGGFSANPPLLALALEDSGADDVLLVQIEPIGRAELPVTAPAIRDRMAEIVFNAPLVAELQALALAARLAAGDRDDDPLRRRLAALRLHRIDGGATLAPLGAATKARPDRRLLAQLHDRGREAADRWLAEHFTALGRRPTLDLAAPPLPVPAQPAAARA